MGAREPRGVGRRDREAAWLALRASTLEALAEDEVRGIAGARCRRLYRSTRSARRSWRAACRVLRGPAFAGLRRAERFRLCRQAWDRLRYEDAARSAQASQCD